MGRYWREWLQVQFGDRPDCRVVKPSVGYPESIADQYRELDL
jgi:hypothetical protein